MAKPSTACLLRRSRCLSPTPLLSGQNMALVKSAIKFASIAPDAISQPSPNGHPARIEVRAVRGRGMSIHLC